MPTFRRAALGAAIFALACAAQAQAWPAKPVRLIIPFPAGGGTDAIAREITSKLATSGYTFVVDNKPGSGGNLGVDAAAKSQPDGYTLVIGQTSNLAINPTLYSKLPYDPVKDLTPVSLVASAPLALVVGANSPYKTLADVTDVQHQRLILPERIAYMTTFCTAELRDRGLPVNPAQTHYVREQAAIPFALNHKLAKIGGIASYSGAAKRLDKDGLRVLHRSRPQPYLPLIAGKRISAEQVARLRAEVLALSQTEQGTKDLAAIGLTGFDPDPQPRLLALLNWLESKTPVADSR